MGKKEERPGKSAKGCGENVKWEVFMAQTGLCNITKKRMLEDRGAVPRQDVDLLSENQAMHAENFLSSWLREDVEGKNEEKKT